jgi:hypothetical protein
LEAIPASPPSRLEGRAPTAAEARVIAELGQIAERSRGLQFVTPVPVLVQDRGQILRHIFEELEEEELEKAKLIYTTLGLLPADMDIRGLLERVLGEQVAGYYDQDRDQLVIRDEVMRSLGSGRFGRFGEAHITIVHELVHALQDQHLSLGDVVDEDADSDPSSAYQAVVEGDATLAMLGFMSEQSGAPLSILTQDPALMRRFIEGAGGSERDEELARAPAILRITLLSSYLDGLLFCGELHGRGGWEAINDAHRTPPVSTEQVLHPDRYLAGEMPDSVTVPDIQALADADLRTVESDRLGELELRVYFGQLDDGVDPVAAEGWSGDHLVAYRDGTGAGVVVWFTSWDDEHEATEAAAAARRILSRVPAPDRARHPVVRDGRAVLIVRNLDPALHTPVERAFAAFAQGLPAEPPRTGGAP